MGQFKPMVKMMTTEPSVELKLKKGGAVQKMALGGALKGAMGMASKVAKSVAPAVKKAMADQKPMDGKAPAMPSMAARRAAMAGKNGLKMSVASGPSSQPKVDKMSMAPVAGDFNPSSFGGGKPPSMGAGYMKKGGKAEGGKADTAKDKAMLKKAFKQHDAQEHKGGKGTKLSLKKGGKMATGGVVMGNAGGYATGGVVLGNAGGFKTGGIIKSTSGKTKMVTAEKKGKTNYATGGVTMGNAGGFKKGGAPKKFAEGGSVQDDGRPQKMPQGNKPPSKPVSITRLSGSFKKGGGVKKMAGGGSESDYDPIIDRENARMQAEKNAERADNEAMREMILGAPKRILQGAKRMIGMGEGSVSDKEPKAITKTEKSVTISPAKKKRGGAVC